MKIVTTTFTIAATIASVSASTSGRCTTDAYGPCGNEQGVTCCPRYQYCQPWNSNYYQCRDQPTECMDLMVDTDFNGDDLQTIYGVQPGECCARCASTNGCKAYTFVNANPGMPACYLKKGMGTKQTKKGAVSGLIRGWVPPSSSGGEASAPGAYLSQNKQTHQFEQQNQQQQQQQQQYENDADQAFQEQRQYQTRNQRQQTSHRQFDQQQTQSEQDLQEPDTYQDQNEEPRIQYSFFGDIKKKLYRAKLWTEDLTA